MIRSSSTVLKPYVKQASAPICAPASKVPGRTEMMRWRLPWSVMLPAADADAGVIAVSVPQIGPSPTSCICARISPARFSDKHTMRSAAAGRVASQAGHLSQPRRQDTASNDQVLYKGCRCTGPGANSLRFHGVLPVMISRTMGAYPAGDEARDPTVVRAAQAGDQRALEVLLTGLAQELPLSARAHPRESPEMAAPGRATSFGRFRFRPGADPASMGAPELVRRLAAPSRVSRSTLP